MGCWAKEHQSNIVPYFHIQSTLPRRCERPAKTDTPIIEIAAKSHTKINYRGLTEINSRYYGLSIMRALTRGPYSVSLQE